MKRNSILLVVALVLAATSFPGPSRIGNAMEMDAILAAWGARQAEVETIRVQWTAQVLESDFVSAPALQGSRSTGRTASFRSSREFLLDRSARMRFQTSGKSRDEQRNLVDTKLREAFDGQAHMTFFPKGAQEFPSLHITNEPLSQSINVHVVPLRLVYRPLDRSLGGLDRNALTLDTTPAAIDGNRCIAVRQKPAEKQPLDMSVWVDPTRDYIPLRFTLAHRGKTIEQIDISAYKRDDSVGWVPYSWSIASFFANDGRPGLSETATVTSYTFNEKFPDDSFTIAPEPGTVVKNYITKENYIYRADARKRPFLPGEFNGKNYEQILNTEPQASNNWRRVFIAVNAGVLVILAAALWRKRAIRGSVRDRLDEAANES